MTQLIEIQYFGCIDYYATAIKNKHVILEQFESYQKMSYRNRCQVLGPVRVVDLTVPLIGGRDQKSPVKEIRIDNQQRWQIQHWRTLESCYNKSAFFLHYKDGLESLLFSPFEKLWQLNMASINWVLKQLKATVELSFSELYEKHPGDNCIDLRNQLLPSNRVQHQMPAYQQVFERPFETNLCILDLLFNMGPQALQYLLTHASTSRDG